jgi:hypothetical protein
MRYFTVILLTGCVVGGGPVIGYGERGLYAGAEVSAGGEILLPQVSLGYQSDQQLVYVRTDEAVDVTGMQRPPGLQATDGTWVSGGRIGGGVGLSFAHDDATPVGVFAIGPSAGHALHRLNTDNNSCDVSNTVGVVELQVRYVRGWSIAFVPRIESGSTFCN